MAKVGSVTKGAVTRILWGAGYGESIRLGADGNTYTMPRTKEEVDKWAEFLDKKGYLVEKYGDGTLKVSGKKV